MERNIRKQPIYHKLITILIFIAISTALVLITFSIISYNIQEKNIRQHEADEFATRAADIIRMNADNVLNSLTVIFGTDEFKRDLDDIKEDGRMLTEKRLLIQNELSSFASSNYLIASVLIVSGDGTEYYTLYKDTLDKDALPVLTQEDLGRIDGITWLTERNSPFINPMKVIPMVVPFSVNSFIKIADGGDTVDAYLIAFLDAEEIKRSISHSSQENNIHDFIFFSTDGLMLSEEKRAIDEEGLAFISESLQGSGKNYFENENCMIIVKDEGIKGIAIVDYIDKFNIVSNVLYLTVMIFIVALVTIIVIMFVSSMMIRRWITNPVNALIRTVNAIENGEYDGHVVLHTNDELEVLSAAITSMGNTIHQQIQSIKEEKDRQYRTELKLLSEQLNPHFLYNTLECIRQEVVSEHIDNASSMIKYLSQYLHTGLAYGNQLVTVANEIKHTQAYIKIMSYRFHQPIILAYQGDSNISNTLILKSILQPLVENSIKHGFNIDSSGIVTMNPSIEIRVSKDEGALVLEVVDNGSGFDGDRMSGMMKGTIEPGRHFGLTNIYNRLTTFYGEENISIGFSSIPFYSNSIRIVIRQPQYDDDSNPAF